MQGAIEDRRDNELVVGKTLVLPPNQEDIPKPLQCKLLEPQDDGFTLKHVITRDECQYIMQQGRDIGLVHVNAQSGRLDYRNNERVLLNSPELSARVWERISSFIHPLSLQEGNIADSITPDIDRQGLWEPYGLNSLWRLCRYEPGGHFAPHRDGQYVKDTEARSFKTFMLYLNDEYQGGCTNFLSQQTLWKDPSDGKYKAQPDTVVQSVKAEPGEALVFNHHILHEGAAVQGHEKWILRSDIMYRRVPGSGKVYTDKQRQALDHLRQAQAAETDDELDAAMRFYRRAWHLWPELEHQC